MNKHTNEPRHEKGDDEGLHLRSIPINRIVIGKDHRSHDAEAINDMAVSIREVGVITPVVVTHAGKNEDGKSQYDCVSGGLRIHGAKEIGYTEISAIVLKGDEDHIQLCRIAADLFRDNLTVLQQAEFLKDWLKIIRTKGGQSAKHAGNQPHDKGLSNAAKALKLSRRMVGRLETICDLSAEVKEAIKAAKLDNSQKSMLAIAKEGTEEKQVKKVNELRRRKDAKKEGSERKKSGSPSLVPAETPDTDPNDQDFDKLKSAWENSPEFVAVWENSLLPTRERFIKEILRRSARADAPQADEAVGHE
jgi:ParB/RepB/Spo0J family partition protein